MTTDLITILLLLPLHSLAILGVWRAAYFPLTNTDDPRGWPQRFPIHAVDTKRAGVLWPIRYLAERYLPVLLQKPIITCPACMATLWGPLPFYLIHGMDWTYLLYWPALSALNTYIVSKIHPEN